MYSANFVDSLFGSFGFIFPKRNASFITNETCGLCFSCILNRSLKLVLVIHRHDPGLGVSDGQFGNVRPDLAGGKSGAHRAAQIVRRPPAPWSSGIGPQGLPRARHSPAKQILVT